MFIIPKFTYYILLNCWFQLMEEMLCQIKEGNRIIFRKYYDEMHAKLYGYIFKYTRSAWLAEETVQMSFVKLWENRERLSDRYTLSAQLFRIAKSTLIDLLRKNALRKVEILEEYPEIYKDSIVNSKHRFQPEIRNELENVLHLIRDMPDMQKKVFSYSRIQGFSHKEIAEMLSISTKTVETHITRAVKFLRKSVLNLLW